MAVAKEWKESRMDNADIEKVTKPFDWTFTTDYKGTITNQEHLDIEESEDKIDFEKLKKREKILYFDEMVLFEDELADNGSAELNLKVGKMLIVTVPIEHCVNFDYFKLVFQGSSK